MSTLTKSNSKKEAYWLYHNDGLLEIFAGLLFLMFGVSILAGMPWLAAIFPPTLWPVWQSARKRITLPRIQESELISESQIKRQLAMMVILFTITAGLGFVVMLSFVGSAYFGLFQWLKEYYLIVLGFLISGGISATGLILGVQRFQLYALLSILVFLIGYLVGLGLPVSMIILAGVMFLGGLVVFVRFMSKKSDRGS